MIRAELRQVAPKIILELDLDSAMYIMELTQNCIGMDPENEPQQCYDIRHNIFHALKLLDLQELARGKA